MTKELTLKAAAIMNRYAGNQVGIEHRDRRGCDWRPCLAPIWDWMRFDYRIARVPKEFYVSIDQNGIPARVFLSPDACERLVTLKVREVFE